MDDAQKLREDAWATLKQMHDDLAKPKEPELRASGGWCAPSGVVWTVGEGGVEAVIPLDFRIGTYRQVNARGQVIFP